MMSAAGTASLSQRERDVLDWVPTDLFIAGQWRAASGGGTLPVEDPATAEPLLEVADAQPQDAIAALTAAADAQAQWGAHPPRERGEILRRAYEAMIEKADELALLMTLEMGKSLAESRAEITYAAEFLRWFSEEAVRIHGRYMVAASGIGRVLTMRQPVGPCVFVTPWNFPTAMGTRKIGPAIAAGCTMVVKPAKLQEAGLPEGVLNVISAKSAGSVIGPLLKDPRARKLSFTGSTEVGRSLIEQSAEQVLRVSMELGGNAPFLVFEDADLDAAVEGAMLAKMRNVGEACTAANRFHVHESLADEFARRLAEKMGALRIGRGTEPGVDVGPLIDEAQRSKVTELVGDAVQRGARVLVGGGRLGIHIPATSTSPPSSLTSPTRRNCWARRSSVPSRPLPRSQPRSRRFRLPTAPSTASSHTSTRRISRARSACARAWRPAWSGSTRASSPTPLRPSVASSSPASAARAASRASASTWRPSTSP
jgi:succinate-semialdehyde dehydrogenase/glutarate-semialdehyde dehydrogenase